MKKFFSLALCLTLCFTACFFVGCGKNNKNSNINWDGLTIANFDKYDYLGVASVDSTPKASTKSIKLTADEEENNFIDGPVVLAGITGTGECEEISFVNEKGEISKQDAHLVRFDAYDRYSFAIFSTTSDEYKDSSWNLKNPKKEYIIGKNSAAIYIQYNNPDHFFDAYFFIIDNKTGKIYSFDNIAQTLNLGDYYSVSIFTDSLNYDYFDFYYSDYNYQTSKDEYYIYEVRFEENNIKVRERMNPEQVNNFLKSDNFYPRNFAFDKFGNIFNTNYLGDGYSYLTASGTFDKFKSNKKEDEQVNYYLGFNGVMYRDIKKDSEILSKSYLAADGSFAEIDKDLVYPHAPNPQYNTNTLIWNKGNVYYFGYSQETYSSNYIAKLTVEKVTTSTENDWEYTIETIILENYEGPSYETNFETLLANMVYVNGNFYTVSGNDVFYYNATTGEKHQIENNYNVNKFFVDRNLNVIKLVVEDNSTLMNIEGYINENNEIVLEEFNPEIAGASKVYVIVPLN